LLVVCVLFGCLLFACTLSVFMKGRWIAHSHSNSVPQADRHIHHMELFVLQCARSSAVYVQKLFSEELKPSLKNSSCGLISPDVRVC
jgi:hypothetical protein